MSARVARVLAVVGAATLAGSALGGPAPDPRSFWRTFFARPATIPAPARDPLTAGKIALGRRLFADTRLSGSNARACATCHRPDLAFTDGRPRATALSGAALARNVPTLWNVAWSPALYWDGRVPSLETQAREPVENPHEMAGDWPVIVARLRQDTPLASDFARAFPESPFVSAETVTRALAAYERSLMSPPTRFDRWIAGDGAALDGAEQAGFALFVGKAGCVGCHAGWRFTDDGFHDIGLAGDDPGRGAVPGGIPGLKAFKTPSLREARWTAPYMHDGSRASLEAVVEHYTSPMGERSGVSARLVRPLVLTVEEKARLITFLRALSGDRPPVAR